VKGYILFFSSYFVILYNVPLDCSLLVKQRDLTHSHRLVLVDFLFNEFAVPNKNFGVTASRPYLSINNFQHFDTTSVRRGQHKNSLVVQCFDFSFFSSNKYYIFINAHTMDWKPGFTLMNSRGL
jgi:hypothetical protein